MAFPVERGGGPEDTVSPNTTAHVAALPVEPADGDYAVVLAACFGDPAGTPTTPEGWTRTVFEGPGFLCWLAVYERLCDGSEGDSVTIVNSLERPISSRAWVYQAGTFTGTPQRSALTQGFGTSSDPASLTPAFGEEDALWTAVLMLQGVNKDNPTTYPTGYSSASRVEEVTNYKIATATKQQNVASDDPSAFAWSGGTGHLSFVMALQGVPDEEGTPSLSIDEQPTATQSGYLIDPAPVVHVLDAEGALDTSFTGDVTASLLGSGGVLLGTLTVAAVAGVATFPNLRPCEAGSYQLRFSATGYANLDSAVFTVTAGEGSTNVIVHQEAPMRPIRRNEPTAEQRDIPLVILADDGSPWDGDPDDGGGLKAQLSVNFGTETPSPANIVKLAPGDFRVRPTDAYTDIAEGSIIKARVPAAAGRRQAFGYAHIIPNDSYVSAEAARKALVDAVVIASDGGNGYDVVKQPESNQIQRTIPDVGVITITATFSPSVPGIVSAGGS